MPIFPMFSQTTVLVTGGTGLYGKAIEAAILKQPIPGERWIFLGRKDGDLTKLEETRAIFEKYQPTHVIHLAAKVGGLFHNMKYKVEFFRDNMLINDNILLCCKDYNVSRCVSILSTCIFPDAAELPLDESKVHSGPPHRSNEGYAYAKRMVDVMNRLYYDQYGLEYTSVVPTNIFGPHDNFNVDSGHVIPGLINKCWTAKNSGEDFTVWGSGKPLRQFIYSKDVAELTIWALREYKSIEPLILCPSPEDEISIGDLAHLIAECLDFKGKIVFDTTKADGQFRKTASNKKLVGLFPEFKFTPMRQAIMETCQWYAGHLGEIRK